MKFWVIAPGGTSVYSKQKTVFTPAYAETNVSESFSFNSETDGSHNLYAEILTTYTPHPQAAQSFGVSGLPGFPFFPPTLKKYALVVQVVDLFGMNAPDLTVKVMSDSKVLYTLVTDSAGLTEMVSLPKGQYTINVYINNLLQLQQTLTLEADTSARLQIGIPILLTFARIIIILLVIIVVVLLLLYRRKRHS